MREKGQIAQAQGGGILRRGPPLGPGGREGQAAGLGAEAAVAAAGAKHRGQVTLSGYAHAQRAVDKHLDFTAQPDAGGDFLPRHLPREHHAGKARVPQKTDARRGVAGELGGGVKNQTGRGGAQAAGQTEILHDQRVHPEGAGFFRHPQRILQLFLPDEGGSAPGGRRPPVHDNTTPPP